MPYPRPLTDDERSLARWMLEHGEPGADRYLDQLRQAVVVSGCSCGCATVNFQIGGAPVDYESGLTEISHYVFQRGADHFGIFLFTQDDMLSGMEVYGFEDAPGPLPQIHELIPFEGGHEAD